MISKSRVGPHPVSTLLLTAIVIVGSLGASYILVLWWTLRRASQAPNGCEITGEFAYVVPGKQLKNDLVDDDFSLRLQHCWQLWQQHSAEIYLLGGSRNAATITEAQAGKNWLEKQGVPSSQITLEQRSKHSLENLWQLRALVTAEQKLVLVSNRYHLPRLSLMASALAMRIHLVAAEPVMNYSPGYWLRWLKEAFYIHWFYLSSKL
ncbi:YdcF family protein [Oceanicoccus sp. KOV_DT_Chl]|uniref:YdcF family protein n=1 Tax=Oceanicoccus sp. KOV_DT_Chl TaxID=1904639 RepID=UPI000C7A541F|nr:YdcF family protein [Oceanicoccus sp. KOV_DT_Chl]